MKQLGKLAVGALVLAGGWGASAGAAEQLGALTLSGYLRQDFSVNLGDVPETTQDDQWDLQMNRQTVFLETFAPVGDTRWTGRFRYVHEFLTDYEERLQTQARGLFPTMDFKDEYQGFDVREFFVDFDIGRVSARLGKQQVVWGETDFFHATDVIHGYDFRWRSFLEPANEDVRKPLTLVNATVNVPEVEGALQLIVRPGLDRDRDVGNSIPAFGGRWSNNLAKGVPLGSFTNPAIAPFAYHWDEGDVDDPHYGARWSGAAGDVNYSLSYYHGQSGFQQDPILIFDPSIGLGFVLPFTDTFGASVTGYIPAIDSVYRAEVAFTPDRKLGTIFGTVVEQDGYNFVLGLDHTLRLQDWVGTSAPSLFSLQLFDWYLPGVAESDNIVRFDGAGYYDEHNAFGTVILTLPYMHETLTGTLVGLIDLTNGGGMVIPSVEYAIGEHWRIKGEVDLPIGGNEGAIVPGNGASLFGALANNPQFLLRTTFLF